MKFEQVCLSERGVDLLDSLSIIILLIYTKTSFHFSYNYEDQDLNFELPEVDKLLYRFLPLIIQAISGAVCYYFARVACKLCMQGFSFSLPLAIITPTTGAIFCYLCVLQVRFQNFICQES